MEIGAQFFTIREHCKNLEDFADTISLRVAEINKNVSPEVSNIQVIQDRHSNVQRVFRTIGEY